MPATHKITFGGWYQRTTLHLSEIYEFLANSNTYLNLDKSKIKHLHKRLNLSKVSREFGYLEYVKALTKDGIEIRYYEDGLYILELDTEDITKAKLKLETYFNNNLGPAINYIFSLGAPVPKVLANIKTSHPTVVSFNKRQPNTTRIGTEFGEIYSKIITDDIGVFKTNEYIFIGHKPEAELPITEFIENLIFFREFKDQLEKYLNVHRKVWVEIAEIKERKMIKPKEVLALRGKLDSYQRTISLISNRINQMSSYARTRKSIAQKAGADNLLANLFQYRFEVLLDTLDYIKEIWKMTTDYVNSAIQVMVEIQNMATNKSIQSLTLITSVGVIAGLVGHLSRDVFPKVTLTGIMYLSLLIATAGLINLAVRKIQSNIKRKLSFVERNEDI